MSLAHAINTPEGEFIRGGFEATVSNAASRPTKKGGTFFVATLTDGQDTADAVSFDQTFEHDNGKRVRFSGMGLKRGENYNGKAKVVIGGKAKREYVNGSESGAVVSSTPPSTQARPSQAPAVSGSRPEGQSVGNALTNATHLAIKNQIPLEELEAFLFTTCSKYLSVSRRLMNGELATDKPSREANQNTEDGGDVPF
jgi:hypothetical protein